MRVDRMLRPRMLRLALGAAVAAAMALGSVPAEAGVISSAGGGFQVGITDLGNLYDPASFNPDTGLAIGFLRVSDDYDPIEPGTPREAYGISAGGTSGFVDPESFGVANIVGISATFLANTASITTALDAGAGQLLTITQLYSFAAENILQIQTTITNVSGAAQSVLFAREVDHDINPAFVTTTVAPPLAPPILDATSYGFENPDPLVPYGFSTGPGGGSFGPADNGNGFKIDLGTLADGESVSFNIYHGLSTLAQDGTTSDSQLRAQLAGLGASFILTSIEGDGTDPASKAAALAYGPAVPPAVPEPSTVVLGLMGGLASLGYGLRRRARARTA